MGITIIQKSDLAKVRPDHAKALILAGGAVTGGSFKAGGIKALNDYLIDSSVNDFDIFLGISSGSLIAAPLVGGISPESILKSLDGTSGHFTRLTAWHYYRPNLAEFIGRPIKFIVSAARWLPHQFAERGAGADGVLAAIWRFVLHPTLEGYDQIMERVFIAFGEGLPSLLSLLPSGIFDNRPIESYVRGNIKRNRLTNDFRETVRLTGKRLYISAMRLDDAKRVVFGPDEDCSVTISQAIQASTAMPGFYKPARINDVDYVDGGVHETANIDVAVKKGARLIVCCNPFRPYDPDEFVHGFSKQAKGERLAASSVLAVLSQIFRAFFHARLHVKLDHFRKNPSFKGDIILIEPRADDVAFFALNPLSLSNRLMAARLGFKSVRNSIDEHFDEMGRIMSAYGMRMSRAGVENEYRRLIKSATSEGEVQTLLEGRAGVKRRGVRKH
jgi:predicted acylesterase/phospholipase RssA